MAAQGFDTHDNVIYQDNQSAILQEKNGRASSGWHTWHIDIKYFFITNRVKRRDICIEYCPTGDMVADFFTKPLQGSLFHKLCSIILNIPGRALPGNAAASQECVENKTSYADMVRGTRQASSDVDDAVHQRKVESSK